VKTTPSSPCRFRSGVVALILTACISGVALAADTPPQKTITIDLAAIKADSVFSRPGRAGTEYSFRLVNRLPDPAVTYEVSIELAQMPVRELTLFGASPRGNDSDQKSLGERRRDCAKEQEAAREIIATAKDEASVPARLADAVNGLPKDCSQVADALRGATEQSVDNGQTTLLGSGEELKVVVRRTKGDGTTLSWTYRLTTASGEWRAAYGFTFVPNEDDRFVTEAQENGKFKILAQADRERLDYVPSVLFVWNPPREEPRWWKPSFTAGLGYDLELPVVLAGAAWTVHQNITVTAGVAVHQQTRLLGRYREGQEIAANLDPSQLTENTYGPNVYAGVAFRFGQDPHARTAQLQEDTAAREAAAKEAKAQKEKRIAACEAAADENQKKANAKCNESYPAPADPNTDPGKPKRDECLGLAEAAKKAAITACPLAEETRLGEERAAAAAKADAAAKAAAAAAEKKAAAEQASAAEKAANAQELRDRCDAKADAEAAEAIAKCAGTDAEKATCEKTAKAKLAAERFTCQEDFNKSVGGSK